MNLNSSKILNRLVFVYILIFSRLIISSQSIYEESFLDLNGLIGIESSFKICSELDYDGDSKYEILVKDKGIFSKGYHFIDYKNQILKHSFTGEVFENFFLDSDNEFAIRFKGRKNDNIHFDNFSWKNNRIYDPIMDDIIKLDFEIDDAIISDLNNDGYPEIIGKMNFSDTVKVFSFLNSCTYKNLISVVFKVQSIHIAQMDQDEQKEIVIIGNSSNLIVDPFTLETEVKNLSLSNVDQMESFQSNGKNKLFFISGTDNVGIYDVEENKIQKYRSLNSNQSPSMKVFYLLDSLNNSKPYLVILNDKLTIIDANLTTIFTIDDLDINLPLYERSQFILNDFDDDRLPNFLIYQGNKISNFEINGLGSFYRAFQLHDQYPYNNQEVSSSFEFLLAFNEAITLDSIYQNISLAKSDGTIINDLLIRSEDDCVFYISPQFPLDEGTYSLFIRKSLRSRSGKKLDLNNDMQISNMDNSDYEINFQILEQSLSKPTINLISELPDSMYIDMKHEMLVEINSNIINTPFKSIKSGFENDTLTSIIPSDGVLNKNIETLRLFINTDGRNEGTENYKIIVETINNSKDSVVFPLKIVIPKGYPYPMNGTNLSYTNCQKRKESNNIFEHKWTLNINKNYQWVVGENGYIYYFDGEEKAIVKLDYFSKDVIWKLVVEGTVSELFLEKGIIYFVNSIESNLYVRCIDSNDGKKLWETKSYDTFSQGVAYMMKPISYKDYVLVPTDKGIFCLNRWNGKELWSRPRDHISRNIIVYNDRVFAFGKNRLMCLKLHNGALLFEKNVGSESSYNGNLILDTENQQLIYDYADGIYAVNLMNFEQNWFHFDSGHKNLFIRNDKLYYYEVYDNLYIIDLATGEIGEHKIKLNQNSALDDVFIYGDFLVFSYPNSLSPEIYRADNLRYINSLDGTGGGQISMVNDMLFFSTEHTISAYNMLPPCYEQKEFSFQICKGDSLSIQNKYYSSSGTYIDTVFTADSCHQIFNINLFVSNPVITETIILHDSGNSNGKIVLHTSGGIPPYTYYWSGGASSNEIDSLAFGLYSVSIIDSLGCEIFADFTILDTKCDSLGGDFDDDGFCAVYDCDDFNSYINPNQTEVQYNELDDDCDPNTLDDDLDQDGFLLSDDCDDNNPNINPDAEEIPNNGIDEDCDGMDLVSGIYNLAESTIRIYPNPVSDQLIIKIDGQLNFKVSLFDLSGKQVFYSKNERIIDVNSIPQGTYLLEIEDIKSGKKVVDKIVVGK